MFTHVFLLQATWRYGRCWIQSRRRRSRGPESTRSSNKHVQEITCKWTRSTCLPYNTWRRRKHPIFIAEWSSWIIRTHWNSINPDGPIFAGRSRFIMILEKKDETTRGLIRAGDHDQTTTMHPDLLLTVDSSGLFDLHRTDDDWRNDVIAIRQPRCSSIFLSPWRHVELSGASALLQRGDTSGAIMIAQSPSDDSK